jgi:hypothetical protein
MWISQLQVASDSVPDYLALRIATKANRHPASTSRAASYANCSRT